MMSKANSSFTLPPLPPLAIDAIQQELVVALRSSSLFILEAAPGTGKSSRVPLWIAQQVQGKVLVLEPRRVAASLLARHLASLLGQRVGECVGLQMRNVHLVSAQTRVLVVTEGVFTRMLCADQALTGIDCVLFDEFHERNLHSDLGLALALESQAILREDLRLGILSATIDSYALQKVFPQARLLQCPLQSFPVSLHYANDKTVFGATPAAHLPTLSHHMAKVIVSLLEKHEGSVLAFLPGAAEIIRTQEELEALLAHSSLTNISICPLYGKLSAKEQEQAVAKPAPHQRKIVLATDIAESSVTIEGIRLVVDSGLQRRPHFVASEGRTRLQLQWIPKASAIQRAGRAGRLEQGICVRLWSQEIEAGMLEYAQPEILETDLTDFALVLALWGSNAQDLSFVTAPPETTLTAAYRTLSVLGACTPQRQITPRGKMMLALGIDARLACVLIHALQSDFLALALVSAALLEDDSRRAPSLVCADLSLWIEELCTGQKGVGQRSRQDIIALERLQRRLQHLSATDADAMVSATSKKTLALSVPALLDTAKASLLASPTALGNVLLPGFVDRLILLKASTSSERTGLSLQGSGVLIQASAALCHDFIIALSYAPNRSHVAGQAWTRVSLFCQVARQDVLTRLAHEIHKERVIQLEGKNTITVFERERLAQLILSERSVAPSQAECEQALIDHIKAQGFACLPFAQELEQWQQRMQLVHTQLGDEWPQGSQESLLALSDEWLPMAVQGCRSLTEIKLKSFLDAIYSLLGWHYAQQLEQLAPLLWLSPCQHKHTIEYTAAGPCVQLKLQECFGLATSPTLPCGVPIRLHLLSPSGVVLAITTDLRFFWNNAYPDVLKQMRGRYPKHPWPDNPLTAQATTLTKKGLAKKQGS